MNIQKINLLKISANTKKTYISLLFETLKLFLFFITKLILSYLKILR